MRALFAPAAPPGPGLQTLAAIRHDESDGVVFNPSQLADYALDGTASQGLSREDLIVLCELLTGLRDARSREYLQTLASHADAAVRQVAKAALENTRLPSGTVNPVIALRAGLVGDLKPGTLLPSAPDAVLNAVRSDDALTHRTALTWVSERKEPWAIELLLTTATDDRVSVGARQAALALLAPRINPRVNKALLSLINNADDPARIAAIEAVSLEDERVLKRLNQILRDAAEPAAVRLAAAQRVMVRDPTGTLAVLREGLRP